MAYPFHRLDAATGITNWIPTHPGVLFPQRQRFRRAPAWRRFKSGQQTSLMEAMEPRLLLSADFIPVAGAEAAADGIDLLSDLVEDFLTSEELLDQRIPFLLGFNDDVEGEERLEALSINDLFEIPVDANGDGFIDRFPGQAAWEADDDEALLEQWDLAGNGDEFVTVDEILNALFFDPMSTILEGHPATADAFIAALDGEGIAFFDGLDTTLDNLSPLFGAAGTNYTIVFDIVDAATEHFIEDPSAELSFSVGFELTISRDGVPIDLGLEADDLRLLAFEGDSLNPDPVTVDVDASLSFGFEFGVRTSGQSDAQINADDFFIRRADDLLISITAVDGDMDFNLNIGFLGAEVIDGSLNLQADVVGTLVDPNSPVVLGFDESQYGVENTSGVVLASNDIPSPDMDHEAGFFLRIGNLGIATEVLVADDNGNVVNAGLIADINAALTAADLDGLVEVSLSGSKVQFSLVSGDVSPLGFDDEALAIDGNLLASSAPGTFEPGSTVSFLLSVGGALPRLISVRFPDAAREDIGFAANQDGALSPLIAQSAANGTGTLDEGGDLIANFTLRITHAGGVSTNYNISVAEGGANANVVDLVADLNSALTTAGANTSVLATHAGGVIRLSPVGATVSAIEIISADDTTEADIGLFAGQASFLSMTAANVIGDVTFNDGISNTNDDAHFVLSVNGVDHDITVAADNSRQFKVSLANAIDAALSSYDISAMLVGNKIVLTADDNSVNSFSVTAKNLDINDLVDDVDRALSAAGVTGVSVSHDGGNLSFSSGGSSLETTNTLTFDAGVTGAELNPLDAVPDASFAAANGEDSNITFNLPVSVKAGLRVAGTTDFYDPQNLAIIGNFDPFGLLGEFVDEVNTPNFEDPANTTTVNRFLLDFEVTPAAAEPDPVTPIAVPNPVPAETLQLVNFAEALQFNQIGPGSFIGMLGELGAALDSIMQDPLFAGYDIPFTDATLRDIVAFEDMIHNSIIYDLGPDGEFAKDAEDINDDDERLLTRVALGGNVIKPNGGDSDPKAFQTIPTFSTAQEMGVRLADILSLPQFADDVGLNAGGINPTYDPDSNELTYDMDLISSDRVSVGVDDPDTTDPELDAPFTSSFEFDVDLAPFGEFLITAAGVDGIVADDLLVTIEARTTFSATYGFDLSPNIDPDPLDDDHVLEERFFVRNATLGGAFVATLPDVGVKASALLGIIGIDITDIDGSFGAQFSAQLKNEGGADGSQVSLQTLQQDIQDTFIGNTEGNNDDSSDSYLGLNTNGGQEALEIVSNPVVSKLQTMDFDDQVANVVAGSKLVSDSDGTAYVLGVEDSGSTGTLLLFGVDPGFADDDEFFDVRNLANRGGIVDGGVVTQTYFGELDMQIAVQEGFDDTGFGAELADLYPLSGNIDLNLAVFGNPNADLDPAVDADDLNDSLALIGTDVGGTFVSLGEYAPVDYFDLIAVLEQLGDLVAELEEAFPVLSQTLPVVNKSFSELLGLNEGVDRAVAQARSLLLDQQSLLGLQGEEVPTLTLQGLATALRGAFGLAATDGVSLVIDVETVDGTPYLTLDFDIEETISTTLSLDIDLGINLPNLTSGKVLRADGTLGWGFKVGIALDNGVPSDLDYNDAFKLFNPQGGLEGDLSIVGEGAEGVGLVFLAQVGDATVQVMDALVDIQLDFSLAGLNFNGTNGIKTLADVEFGDFPIQLVPTQHYDVSIPLFDISGGLTGFLTEIAVSGEDLIDDAANLLNGLPGVSELATLEGEITAFVDSLEDLGDFNPLENLLLLTDAADLFFEIIQDALDQATSVGLPIIGDKLSEGARFIEGFRDQFINQFRQLIEVTNDISLEDVTDYINDFFVDVIGLDFVNIIGNLEEGDLGDIFDDEIRWELHLGDTYDVAFDLGFDLGVPLLNLSSDIPVELGITWALDIGLGVNRQDGAFIILEDEYIGDGEFDDRGELEVRAFIDLPTGTPFKGTLGFLEVEILNMGSGLEFLFGVDLSNEGGIDPTILPIADIGNLGFDVMIGGGKLEGNDHILDLALSVGVSGVDNILPKLTTDFVMDWSLAETAQDAVDNIIKEGLELLDFGEVKIDLTSLLNGFIGDVLSGISDFLGPLLDISDFLNEDIPIISQLFGPTSLLDLAELLGLADTRLFEALDQIGDIIGVVSGLSGDAFITLGDLEIFDAGNIPNADFADALFDQDLDITKAIEDNFTNLTGLLTATGKNLIADFSAAVASSDAPGTTKSSFTNTTNLSVGGAGDIISLPWLQNPELLLGLLVGQDVSLIEIDLPPLGVGFDYNQFVTIFGPLGASIGFGFFVGADFSAGFNTFGLNRFADSGFTNPGLIFDGFFLGDRENITEGADIEELFLEMTLTAAAELNLGIASGGVGGGITARLGLNLYDPDSDGAVHISELINTIEHELRSGGSDFDAARSIFDLTGSISAELFWYLKILTAKFGGTIFGPEEVFSFEIPFERTPILGTEIDTTGNGNPDTLIINAGPNSIDRLNGDVSDGNESFLVEYQGGDIAIKSPALGVNAWQVYDGNYNHIIFLGGQGNDSITFEGFDDSNITFDLRGGIGDDVIKFIENPGVLTPAIGAGAVIRGGAGNDRLIGSHLNDEIYGELGNDTIEGGRGYDILIGDSATLRDGPDNGPDKTIGARVSDLDGDDTIDGGDSDDIIIGGGGKDTLSGGAGADVILGDGGRFGYDLDNLDNLHIDVGAFVIQAFVPNDRLNPEPTVSTARQMDNILLALQGIFTGTNLGGGADDIINGNDGDDIIFGGDGNDDISGGADKDYVVGGKGFDEIDGDGGDDVLFGNDQDDIINGGDGSDVIAGGFGDDTLHGDADNDYMTGSRGRDIMYGDGGDDEMHGEGEPDIMFGGADDDLVIGGVGADIMMGDSGVVVKFNVDGGTDLVIGDDSGTVVSDYEAAAAAGDIDTIAGSLDLILTDVLSTDGNDILYGGEGGDIILGGGGNDLGGGDVDPRRSTANTSEMTTPDGDDVMIGDGGIVEFNQRRLQRIASVFAGDPGNTYRDTLYGDNGDDIIIGGRGSDGDNNGDDPTLNIPSLGIGFMLAGGHGPGRGATDAEVSDEDVIIGDNGELVYVGESDTANFGKLAFIQTTDTVPSGGNANGGADTAFGELGDDIILGGVNGSVDVLSGSLGEDVILGDNGLIHFNYDWAADGNIQDYSLETYTPADGDVTSIDLIRSFNDGLGGIDIISGDAGVDVLLGGEAGDEIYGDNSAADAAENDGGDIILGDNGDLFLAGDVDGLRVQGSAIDHITTTDVAESSGGADTISGNAGADIILGGVNDGGNDILFGDALAHGSNDGDDLILGDNGILLFNFDWQHDDADNSDYTPNDDNLTTLDLVRSFTDELGGTDIISGDVGGDIIFGGTGGDTIHGDDAVAEADDGDGNEIILGDNGDVFLAGTLGERFLQGTAVARIITTDENEASGGADLIEGNAGDDIIIGGVNDGGIDMLHGDARSANPGGFDGDDVILGDHGLLRWDVTSLESLIEVIPGVLASGDDDRTTLDLIQTFNTTNLGGAGDGGVDHIYGNDGSDVAMGGSAGDIIHGDFYYGGSLASSANPSEDVLLGDGGELTFIDAALTVIRTIEPGLGGADFIFGNDFSDTILGGFAGDELYGEAMAGDLDLVRDEFGAPRAGDDWILGDNGRLDFILPSDDIEGRQDVEDHLVGITVTLDPNPATLDRVMTTNPTLGGDDVIYGNGNSFADSGDVIFGGTGSDTIRGDTSDAGPGLDGPDGKDLAFGDHAKLYPTLPFVDNFFINNHFFSIDTQLADLGAGDIMYGNANDDILIGGQGDDVMFGGTGDDDMIGGHNVSGGDDDLDAMPGADQLSISPDFLTDLNPADVNEINDIMDGGAGDDVMAGDNAIIVRQPNFISGGALDNNALASPRFRMTGPGGQMYALVSDGVDGLADIDVGFVANVDATFQDHQDMTLVRTTILLDHSEAIENAAVGSAGSPRPFGNDIMVGGSEDDEMWGQLGDDILQGDGVITVISPVKDSFDDYNPAQDADPSFDLSNFTIRVDLMVGNDIDATLRFDVAEALEDGDDYIEGNGGNDRIYGNLGQDDIIGGSSTLFGLGDGDAAFHGEPSGNALRPDGADLIYGGAGNPILLERNATFGGADNDITDDTIVPANERHATDADTILGDNGDIFRIVEDTDDNTDGVQLGYANFAYDYNATSGDGFEDNGYNGDELKIRPRAVNFADYGYQYVDLDNDPDTREVLTFLSSARGAGDLIYGESGDDVVHGMTGNDVIFGNSEHDDLHGEIGADFLLGGTGIDGIIGDDGLILTSRNDANAEPLNGIAALDPDEGPLKRNEEVNVNSLNAVITTPGGIQVAIINIEGELNKSVELFAFRTDDIDGTAPAPVDEFGEKMRWNDIIFGGLQNDFIHGGDGDDAISGAEALAAYYSGEGSEGDPNEEFINVNSFLQNMQSSPDNTAPSSPVPDLSDNPFWFSFAPYNPGDILRFEGQEILDENGQRARTRDEFAWYDEFNPRRKIVFDFDHDFSAELEALTTLTGVSNPIDFILNFDEEEGPVGPSFDGDVSDLPTDGADRIFGDLGNDWIVGGTGRDHMYGGRGNDLLNMDDNHNSGASSKVGPHDPTPDPLDNTLSDEFQAYADIVYSGAGRDVMILNTGADRAIDWVGEFNSYIVPFSPFGAFHISRTLQPQVPEFLYALSASDGIDARVDETLAVNALDGQLYVDQKNLDVRTDDPDAERAFEPYGELGMVRQTDFDWQEQTGAPNDPQPGNLQGKREIMRRELFSNTATTLFAADVGNFQVENGVMTATPELLGEETVALFHLDQYQPSYMEILVTLNAAKDKAGSKSNGYVIFDYQGPEDFKFAGIDVGLDKIQIGHRDASGWVIDSQTPMRLKANTDYDLTVVLFNSVATVYVNQKQNLSLDFSEPLNDGGLLGVGTNNAIATYDDFQVQQLPPVWTFTNSDDFSDASTNPLTVHSGDWQQGGGSFDGSVDGSTPAVATQYLDLAAFSRLEMTTTFETGGQAGIIFDYYSDQDFKYATLNAETGQVVIGHYTSHGLSIDATVDFNVNGKKAYEFTVSIFGTTASVLVNGQAVLANVFNGLLNDGDFGLITLAGSSSFDDFLVRGDDPAYSETDNLLTAAKSATTDSSGDLLEASTVEAVAESALQQLASSLLLDGEQLEQLSALQIGVADLPGDTLASWQNGGIILDHNAAGHGWFVDHTPNNNAEFQHQDSDSSGKIDLLSTLMHEYGHAADLKHDSGLAFMAEELGLGERVTLPESNVVKVFDEFTGRLLVEGEETGLDSILVVDSATEGAANDSTSLISWGRAASFSSHAEYLL